jgi:hypothetical protein
MHKYVRAMTSLLSPGCLTFQSNPGLDHRKAIKKVMHYMQDTKEYKLIYRSSDNLKVVGYSDADFAGCVDSKKSTSGYILTLAEGVIL